MFFFIVAPTVCSFFVIGAIQIRDDDDDDHHHHHVGNDCSVLVNKSLQLHLWPND